MNKGINLRSSKSLLSSFNFRQQILLNWINSFCKGKKLTFAELPEKFRTGSYPLTLLQGLSINYDYSSARIPPRSREECLNNIKVFLAALEGKGLTLDVEYESYLYQGKSQQCWEIIEFLFSSIYLVDIFEFSDDMFSWYSDIAQCEISYSEMLVLFKDGSILLKILSEFKRGIKFIDFPESKKEIMQNLELLGKCLEKKGIPFLFTPEEYYLNDYADFLYAQLWLIFNHFEEKTRKSLNKSSTESSSKNSFLMHESSIIESKGNLEIVEKKVMNEERRLMYLCDLRMKKETKKLVNVPSMKEIPHSSSQPVLSNTELLICFLLTPRIIQVYINGEKKKVLINFIPNQRKFSLKRESYLIELKEIVNLKPLLVCEIEEIDNFDGQGEEIYIWVNKQPIKLIFKNQEECLMYLNGFEHLLEKLADIKCK